MRLTKLAAGIGVGLLLVGSANAATVILNEYNAVGSGKYLDDDTYAGSTKADTTLGRIEGNGGNWFELVVLGNGAAGSTVDMRNWQLQWAETGSNTTDGTDIWYGSTTVDQGIITLTNNAFWAAVPAGTILTFTEEQIITSEGGSQVVNGTDVGLNFAAGDNWANIYSFDTAYVTTQTNVSGDGAGNFSVGNSDWQLTIRDAANALVFGPTGEGIPSSTGINSNEVFKLEADPTTSITETSSDSGTGYNDGTSSSFGAPNVWDGGASVQDFSALVPEPASIVLLGLGSFALLRRRA